jgi:hypothetical protein
MAENRFKGNLPDYTPLDHSLQKRWQETASLQLGFSNATGKCHFRVWYNKEAPKDSDNRLLSAKIDMSPMTMNLILNCMRAMANGTYSGDTFNIGFKTMFATLSRSCGATTCGSPMPSLASWNFGTNGFGPTCPFACQSNRAATIFSISNGVYWYG